MPVDVGCRIAQGGSDDGIHGASAGPMKRSPQAKIRRRYRWATPQRPLGARRCRISHAYTCGCRAKNAVVAKVARRRVQWRTMAP
jgi:hypothetical protein